MARANDDLSTWLREAAAECRVAAAEAGGLAADALMRRAARYEILAEDVELRGNKPNG
ncbi:hypothetical protein ACRBEV_22825 [Methylobacterium phyllosphaerae]